jgi:hypothetical protein
MIPAVKLSHANTTTIRPWSVAVMAVLTSRVGTALPVPVGSAIMAIWVTKFNNGGLPSRMLMGGFAITHQLWTSQIEAASAINAHMRHSETTSISLSSFDNVLRTTALKRNCKSGSVLHG